jgi:regulator of sirC expression with transglutaminase-like and TPR domain
VVEAKKGNSITNGILYLVLAEMLDLPIRAINIPRQFVLGYFSHKVLFENDFENGNPAEEIKFYVDPTSGAAFSHKDIDLYFKRIALPPTASYFRPMNNKQVIKTLLEQLAKCFDSEEQVYKKNELQSLIDLLDD